MAAIVDIVSGRGLRIGARRRNQPNKSKLGLYKPLLRLYSHLKQLYIKNKAVLSLNNIVCVVKWSLVTYSNCLVIYN